MGTKIKIGSRGSQLALWQSRHVASMLHAGGIETEIMVIETKGDKNLSQPFSKIGAKGIFTEEIESKLLSGEIDIAVHSAKDMQSSLPEGLEIISFMERELPNDVLISSNPLVTIDTLPNFTIGTSSARRQAMLRFYFPDIKIAESRGNLQTRIKKMDEGQYDALILAYAGIHRMNYDHLIRSTLSLETFTPAVAQGSIAIESATALDPFKKNMVRSILNHLPTESCLKAERAFLHSLEGGCSVPIFCLANIRSEKLELNGGVINPRATKMCRQFIQGSIQEPESLGKQLAEMILSEGGQQVLEEIRQKK